MSANATGPLDPASSEAAVLGVFRHSVALTASQAATAGLGIGTTVLAARLLGPLDYGALALLLGLVQCLYVGFVHWTTTALVRFGREALVRDGAAGRVTWSWLALAGTGLLLAFATADRGREHLERALGAAWGATALLGLLGAVAAAKAVEHLLQTSGRMEALAGCRPAGKLATLLVLVWLLLRPPAGVGDVALAIALGFAVQAGLGALAFERRLFAPAGPDLRLVGVIAAWSAPLLLRSALAYALDWGDLFLLRFLGASEAVGVYSAAYQATIVVTELLGTLSTLALPLLAAWRAEGRDDRARLYLERLVPQASALWCLLLACAALAAPLVPVLLGPGFARASSLLGLLLLGASFQAAAYATLPLLAAYDMTGRATSILATAVALNLTGDVLLIKHLGPFGAATATAVAQAAAAVLYQASAGRRLGASAAAALVPPLLTAPALLTLAFDLSFPARAAGVVLSLTAILAWSRSRRVFAQADVQGLALPAMVQRLYALLSR